ncbi:MAG: DUF2300 domain-containing protein [Candidatus Schekmanbacteria bacterium]|nr:DUF2300 domain-containing protein [Candidatus Schekmanbacteria bacterium]
MMARPRGLLAGAILGGGLLCLGLQSARAECRRDPAWEAWLQRRLPAWEERLSPLPGFVRPEGVVVCRSAGGMPFAELEANRIHLPPMPQDEQEISVAHEYLHLAFAHHPAGKRERFVERLARTLVVQEED